MAVWTKAYIKICAFYALCEFFSGKYKGKNYSIYDMNKIISKYDKQLSGGLKVGRIKKQIKSIA